MFDSGIHVSRILSNCANLLLVCPYLMTCMVPDATHSIHVQIVGLVVFGSDQLCGFLVDDGDMWKHHNLGNLLVGAGRDASKECHCPLNEHGRVCGILAAAALSAILVHLVDVLSV
jgi:hypothetical protein